MTITRFYPAYHLRALGPSDVLGLRRGDEQHGGEGIGGEGIGGG